MTTASRPEHGFDLDAQEHRLLRGRPPDRALAWAAAAIGPGARIVAVRALAGGNSSAIHLLHAEDRAGCGQQVVLRRYVRTDWLAEEPDLAEREADVLRVLAGGQVRTPRLVAVDASGRYADVPAVLMTALPGRIRWDRADQGPYLRRLAEQLVLIHATPVGKPAHLRRYRPAYPVAERHQPPRWSRHQRAWQRALEIYRDPPTAPAPVLVHRDYHPGNVLWFRRAVSGVVDWATSCLGLPEADVGHCRANLLGPDTAAAGRFLVTYQELSGRREYHPYWDIAPCVDLVDAESDPDYVLDDWLAAAVAALG
jgi:aminoglycoside phosphotransferase (APT) family kinase protein